MKETRDKCYLPLRSQESPFSSCVCIGFKPWWRSLYNGIVEISYCLFSCTLLPPLFASPSCSYLTCILIVRAGSVLCSTQEPAILTRNDVIYLIKYLLLKSSCNCQVECDKEAAWTERSDHILCVNFLQLFSCFTHTHRLSRNITLICGTI